MCVQPGVPAFTVDQHNDSVMSALLNRSKEIQVCDCFVLCNNNLHLEIIIMYIYHALINTLSAHMIHINLNIIFCTHEDHSPTRTTHTQHHAER